MPEPDRTVLEPRVLDELIASVNGDRAFVVQLVDTYLADSSAQLDAVEATVAADDADGLVRPAHTLKSSSATLGAEWLAASARSLEMVGRSGRIDDEARTTARALRGDWEAAAAALRAWTAGE